MVTDSVVAGLGLPVAQLGRDITLACSLPGLPAARGGELVGSRILAILGGLCAVLGSDFAVVDRSIPPGGSFSASRVGPGAFVRRAPPVVGRAVARGPVEITRGIVTRFGLPIAQLGREVSRASSQRGIFAIPGSLRAILGRKAAIVDRLGAVVGSLGTPRSRLRAFVSRVLPVARGSIPCGSIEVTCSIVTRFGFTVPQPRSHVTNMSGQPCLSAPHTRELVRPGILSVLRRLHAIFRRNPAVVDGLGAVVGGFGAA